MGLNPANPTMAETNWNRGLGQTSSARAGAGLPSRDPGGIGASGVCRSAGLTTCHPTPPSPLTTSTGWPDGAPASPAAYTNPPEPGASPR